MAPYRIWTATDLDALLAGEPLSPADLRVLTVARREFAGEVVDVLRHGG